MQMSINIALRFVLNQVFLLEWDLRVSAKIRELYSISQQHAFDWEVEDISRFVNKELGRIEQSTQ